MSILNKNIQELQFSDIDVLVKEEKPAENEFIDYKREFSESVKDKIHELISAFANTNGGWILIGIEEDRRTGRPKEICYVTEDNLSTLINQICLDRITPPVICDSKYIENDKRDKRVFAIRVEESDLTPHAVDYNTAVYIKVKDLMRPYKRADLDQIEWLRNRRQRYISFRETMVTQAYNDYHEIFGDSTQARTSSEFYVIPRYPKKRLIHTLELPQFLRDFDSSLPAGIQRLFLYRLSSSQDTITVSDSSANPRNHFTRINSFGLYMNKAIYREKDFKYQPEKGRYIDFLEMARDLRHNLGIGISFLKQCDYSGSVLLYYAVMNPAGSMIFCDYRGDTHIIELELKATQDRYFKYPATESFMNLILQEDSLYSQLINESIFALGGGGVDRTISYGEVLSQIIKFNDDKS